ncbi:hypothetical protein DMN91_002350 [Ooceraea biroi]|uniref:receptor protein-tyrosine kinase n=1 Tax=Ooceraea biroi TaxID=2015173 RepID=A0A3L8E0E2_OOCBI|nr:vascular endothelial growth factor receptor 1 isoform X1 [Ooceraea biroi]RLU26184.1 hypothetical protein DMN91_002350 [Ooceraea biroi]
MEMLLLRHALLLVLVVVFALCQVSQSKPTISPIQEEILLNEGDPLEITCTGSNPIKFIYPDVKEDEVNTSAAQTRERSSNGVHTNILQRPRTVFGDTGWYGCTDEQHEINIIPNAYNDPEVNWIYVYVKSDTNFFVKADTYAHLNAIAGDDTIIPCAVTSPNLLPVLSNNNAGDFDDETEMRQRASFDPRSGFTIRNLTVKDSDWYKCKINKDDKEQEVNYVLSVHLKKELSEPKIHDETLLHVTRGQNLTVECTVEVDVAIRYVFEWKIPKNNSRRNVQQFRKKLDENNVMVTSQLTVFDVTYEDAGEYECIIRSIHSSKKTKKNIIIHNPENRYIKLTSQHENYYEKGNGDNVQWVVYINAYPKPELRWLKPNREEIVESQKYSMNTTATGTILKIRSLNVLDMGNYTLEAKNEYITEKMNFTLDIIAKPVSMLWGIKAYYEPNKTAEFSCEVIAFPQPEITWSFLKCPNYPSFENSTITNVTIATHVHDTNIQTTSRAQILIDMSGHVTCRACNKLGCDSVTENVLVSDGVGAFGIFEPKEPVTEGDTIEMTCAASIYNYTDEITWVNYGNKSYIPIERTERLEILQHRTPFTYRSTLKINQVRKSDAQTYACIGKSITVNHDDCIGEQCTSQEANLSEFAGYILIVHDPMAPRFIETNMNKTKERIIEEDAEGPKTMILRCLVEGMPKPTVTWYKDNVPLKKTDQYLFKYDSQELNIKYLHVHDSGKYSCRASNRVGIAENYQQITVTNGWQKLDLILTASIVVLAIILVILAIFSTIKIRRGKKLKEDLAKAGLMHFEEGALECLNPELTVDDQAELLPYDKKWEFPRERLTLGKQLGSGAFGVVMKAEARGICENETVTTVAVKMVRRSTTDPTYVRALASELKIMVHLGKHLNVVNLLGACTKNIFKRELLVIVEYCCFGNLHNYLLRHRTDFINQIDPNTGKFDFSIGADKLTRTVSVSSNNRLKYAALSFSRSLSMSSGTDTVRYCPGVDSDSQEISTSPDGYILSNNSSQPEWRSNYHGDYKDQNLKPICTQDLLSWAFQVARGMEYLSQRKVLHGDLAARNILLTENNVVKICDFGLAKTMYKDDNYKKKGNGPLPIKWMAIESIRDRIFSTQSDIWSFGIVLWEFFTLAKIPYPGMEADKQYQKLIEGYRMEKPEYATSEVHDIMLHCWKAKPTLRPSFTDLAKNIGDLLEENVRIHYISLNTPYMDMNSMNLGNDYLTMMSAPDHATLSSPGHNYVNSPSLPDSVYLPMSPSCQKDESGIFSPRPPESHFEFPTPASDSEDAVELSPMLKNEKEFYLEPIDVQGRRAEFARQRQAMRNQAVDQPVDRDSGYCNAPRNVHLIDLIDTNEKMKADLDKTDSEKDIAPAVINTQDNYVNMPKQKNELKSMPNGFSNPSYVVVSNQDKDQTV